jgi:hypothetical protein
MVIFILAAAAAFLLCILLRSSKEDRTRKDGSGRDLAGQDPAEQDWTKPVRDCLNKNAHTFQSVLLLSLFAAAVLIVIVAAASTFGVMIFLFVLPICFVIWGRWSLVSGLSACPEDQKPRESQRFVLHWLVFISPLLSGILLGRDLIAALIPDVIVSLASGIVSSVGVIVSWISEISSWVSTQLGSELRPQLGSEPSDRFSAVVVRGAWSVAAVALVAWLANNALRERWQTWLIFSAFLLIAVFSTWTAAHAWAVAAICAWLVAAVALATGLDKSWPCERWLVFSSLVLIAIFSTLTAAHAWAVPAVVAICAWLVTATVPATGLSNKWLREQWQTWLVFSSLVLIAIFSTLTAKTGDAWAYAVLLTIRRIASMPEMTYGVLGVVAGLMCGNFPEWMNYSRTHGIGPGHEESNTGKPASAIWPVIIFGGALSGVVLAALLAPYEQTALSRLSGVETPYLKVQFAISPAEKQLILNVERDLNNLDILQQFPQSLRFIQYDCATAALDAKVSGANMPMDRFVKESEKSRVFRAGLAFRKSLIPYVNRVVSAQRQGYNLPALKGRVRNVAEKFALLAASGDLKTDYQAAMFDINYHEAMFEVQRQYQLFKNEGVGSDALPEEEDRTNTDPDPKYCLHSDEDIKYIRQAAQERPRYIHGFAAALFFFIGDVGAGNAMISGAFGLNEKTDDINLIVGRSDALYTGGQDFSAVLPIAEKELEIIEERIGKIERVKVWSDNEILVDPMRKYENEIRSDLAKRYSRARFAVRRRLAYLWAQHGLASEEDLLPRRDVRWSSAQKYADEAYESLLDKSKRAPQFKCIDDDWDLRTKDTYAFVKLAYQAYNLRTQRIPPDEFEVRQARKILEDALAEAREERRRFEEARSPTGAARGELSCFTQEETRAWVKRISNHLKLADALQP